ncbi:MAG: hypothetical protein NC247_10115 [Ruminococcus flavefaciens]|nr:hypothetical protein [Ruminococcus flavefaciens]MCM1363129.1 hypothetical protein [Clostridiales bacterium]
MEKNIDDSDTNAFRYCGEYYDAETGTIYLRARYYNPTTGRFISRDSFAGRRSDPLSLNRYTYCRNNPVRYVDPSGHDAVDAASFMVNCPRPTHKVNSAWDAHYYTDWDNKFKQILDAPPRVNSQSDAMHRSKVITAVEEKGDSDYYKAWLQLPLDKLGVSWDMPKEVVSKNETMIKGLQPKMRPLVREFLLDSNQSGYPLFITWGMRNNAQEMYNKSNGWGGLWDGPHTKGLAFDFQFWDPVYEDVWPGDGTFKSDNPAYTYETYFHSIIGDYGVWNLNDDGRWDTVVSIGQNIGLIWGSDVFGDDQSHFQYSWGW